MSTIASRVGDGGGFVNIAMSVGFFFLFYNIFSVESVAFSIKRINAVSKFEHFYYKFTRL